MEMEPGGRDGVAAGDGEKKKDLVGRDGYEDGEKEMERRRWSWGEGEGAGERELGRGSWPGRELQTLSNGSSLPGICAELTPSLQN